MLLSSIPLKFAVPFASGAGPTYVRQVPTPSQIGTGQAGAASMTDGFPPLNFIPVEAGGVPPFGQDINGLLFQVTQWIRWGNAGGTTFYDSTFAANIGGYPARAIVESAILPGKYWYNTIDGNVTDPDQFGAGWVPKQDALRTGDMVFDPSSAARTGGGFFGFLPANGGTMGNVGSGANYPGAEMKFFSPQAP